MNLKQLAAMAERLREQSKPKTEPKTEPKKEKPRYRVRNGKIVLRMRATLAKPAKTEPVKPASNVRELFRAKLKREAGFEIEDLKPGQTCPHCRGKGLWTHPDTGRVGTCFWCNNPHDGKVVGGIKAGKGRLSIQDIAFLQKREAGRGPINFGATA